MKIAALIPARKGSKRIKNKNRLAVQGEPYLQIVINHLKAAKVFDDIYLSTDDMVLKNQYKNEINILNRTKALSDDYSSIIDVLSYHQGNELKDYDYIFQIFIHSINLDVFDISSAVHKFIKLDTNRMISICRLPVPLEWTFKKNDQRLVPNFKDAELIRSQDLEVTYFDAGQFYIYKSAWFEKKELAPASWYELSLSKSIDLDEESDRSLIESFYKIKYLNL